MKILSALILPAALSSAGAQVLPHAEWEAVAGDISPTWHSIIVPLSGGRALLTGMEEWAFSPRCPQTDEEWMQPTFPVAYLYEPLTGVRKLAELPAGFPSSTHFGAPILDGQLALIGGGGARSFVYDPDADAWHEVAGLEEARWNFYTNLAATLPDGRVIVTGGSTPDDIYFVDADDFSMDFGSRDVWVFDPVGETIDADGDVLPGSWSEGAPMPVTGTYATKGPSAFWIDHFGIDLPPHMRGYQTGRVTHHTVVLPDGRVLVLGGRTAEPEQYYGLTAVDLYDPELGEWTRLDDMPAVPHDADHGDGGRAFMGVALLGDDEVLVFGGLYAHLVQGGDRHQVWFGTRYGRLRRSALVLDISTGSWRRVGDMNAARIGPLAASWNDGGRNLAIAVGGTPWWDPVAPPEVYDPETETWSSLPAEPRATPDFPMRHGVSLTDGSVLAVSSSGDCRTTVQRLHPAGRLTP